MITFNSKLFTSKIWHYLQSWKKGAKHNHSFIFLYPWLSLFLSVPHFFTLFLSVSVSFYLSSFFLSLSLSLSLFLSFFLTFFLSISLFLFISVPLSFSLSIGLSSLFLLSFHFSEKSTLTEYQREGQFSIKSFDWAWIVWFQEQKKQIMLTTNYLGFDQQFAVRKDWISDCNCLLWI